MFGRWFVCCVRYAHGGGLAVERRAVRGQLRTEVGERFPVGDGNAVIAKGVRVRVVRGGSYSVSCVSVRSRSRTQKRWCSKVSLSTVRRHCRTERPRA